MDILDLTPRQLKRAAAIKERIAALNTELSKLLGAFHNGQSTQRRRRISAAGRRKIAAAQRARWAKRRHTESATRARKSAATANAARSAKMKAYWAKKKTQRK